MKIVIFDLEKWEREPFMALSDKHDVELREQSCTAEMARQYNDAEIISVFIYSQLPREVLQEFKNLKFIVTRSTGFDHIDLDWCEQNGVAVANVPDYGRNTVAEHTFALLLTISHRMDEAVDRTRKGDFSSRGLRGFDLAGRTLGVIGTGAIGRRVIRIAHGFQMRVLGFDVKEDPQAAEEYDFEYVSMDRLLQESDIVTLHVPGNEKTRHMIAAEQFKQMKDGAVLLNTARGQVVEIQALAEALATGKLAYAGLDVLPQEPVIREEAELLRSVYEEKHDLQTLLADSVLPRLRNVVVTPHSAFRTSEAVDRILQTTIENIRSFVQGEPQNVVGGAKRAA